MTVSTIISFAVIAGNLLVIFVFLLTKELRMSAPGQYRLSLACSDLMHGCLLPFILFNVAYTTVEQFEAFLTIWLFYYGLWILSTSVSICTLSALAIDRLRVIWSKMFEASGSSTTATAITIIAIWAVSITIAVIPSYFLSVGRFGQIVSASGAIFIVLDLKEAYVAFFSIGLGFTVASNIALVCVIRSRLNNIESALANSNDVASNRVQVHRKAATTIFFMSGAFVLSVFPMAIYTSLPLPESEIINCMIPLAIVHKYPSCYRRWEASIWLLYVTNGMWNCIIYSFRDTVFRDAIKKICRRTRSRRGSQLPSQNITAVMQHMPYVVSEKRGSKGCDMTPTHA